MFCKYFRNCIIRTSNIDQPGREPVFESASGSTQIPGQFGTINYDQPVSAYEVFTVPADRTFVLEYVSAVVTRGNIAYPPENMNDYGAVGYELNGRSYFHYLPFIRSEPGGVLQAGEMMRLYVPADSKVVVKVPVIPNQSGGADMNVSGHYIRA